MLIQVLPRAHSAAGNHAETLWLRVECLLVVTIWDARTRLPGERTRVRRGGTRRRWRDAADRASVPRRATWRFPNRADAAKIGADAAEIGADATQIGPTRSVSAGICRLGRNGPIWAEIQKKKKKKVQRTI